MMTLLPKISRRRFSLYVCFKKILPWFTFKFPSSTRMFIVCADEILWWLIFKSPTCKEEFPSSVSMLTNTHIQNIQHVKTTSSVSWRALLSDRNVDFKFLRYTKRNFLSAIDSFFYVQMLNKFTKFKPPLIEHNSPNLLVECQQYKWSNWSTIRLPFQRAHC